MTSSLLNNTKNYFLNLFLGLFGLLNSISKVDHWLKVRRLWSRAEFKFGRGYCIENCKSEIIGKFYSNSPNLNSA